GLLARLWDFNLTLLGVVRRDEPAGLGSIGSGFEWVLTRHQVVAHLTISSADGDQSGMGCAVHVHVGGTTNLIRGHDLYDYAVDYGRDVLPQVRAEVERCDSQAPGRLTPRFGAR